MIQLRCFARAAVPLLVLCAACAQTDDDAQVVADTAATAEPAAPTAFADIGLLTPESVLHDEQADVYLVSNINGEPAGRDNNGFIARLRPDGTVEQLKWIEGGVNGVTLNAPKGMAIIGDTLYVSDIDSVRAFNRTTGAALGARGVPGASFLNDLAAGPDGALYVSDTGVDAAFAPTGSDAVYRFDGATATAVARGEQLARPNGVVVDGDGIVVVPFGGNIVMRVATGDGNAVTHVATLPAGQLDGVVRMGDGSLLVTSWEAQAVYRIAPDGAVTTAVENVEAPADIGWDARRNRALIPLFNGNRIEVREIR
jgi:glucose/arabinose dehydrogenase